MSDWLTAALMVSIGVGISLLALSCAIECKHSRQQWVQSWDYQTGAVRVRPVITCDEE